MRTGLAVGTLGLLLVVACGSNERRRSSDGGGLTDTASDSASDTGVLSRDSSAACECEVAPPAECIGSAARTYTAVGATCPDECVFPYEDIECPLGCVEGACVDSECTPGYACPLDSVFHREGNTGRCLFEDLSPPAGAATYCGFFSMGYFGYYWSGSGTCPEGMRYAPSSGTGYCLWEDLELPPGALADCDEFDSLRRMGFRWTCD